jgi:hypothetical protein
MGAAEYWIAPVKPGDDARRNGSMRWESILEYLTMIGCF